MSSRLRQCRTRYVTEPDRQVRSGTDDPRHPLLELQRLAGNAATTRMLRPREGDRSLTSRAGRTMMALPGSQRMAVNVQRMLSVPLPKGLEEKPGQQQEKDPDYSKCLDRGRRLVELIEKASAESPPTSGAEDRLPGSTALFREFTSTTTEIRQDHVKVTTTYPKTGIGGYYENLFYPGGRIVAVKNYHPTQVRSEHAHRVLSSSIILWEQRKIAQELIKDPLDLTIIKRENIDNEVTKKVLQICCTRRGGASSDGRDFTWKWAPGEEETVALLGTPNGMSAAYLVLERGKEANINGIDAIVVEQKYVARAMPPTYNMYIYWKPRR